jgi:hypothetical protein
MSGSGAWGAAGDAAQLPIHAACAAPVHAAKSIAAAIIRPNIGIPVPTPPPGGSRQLNLSRPPNAKDQTVSHFRRRAGPVTASLWPKQWISDGAGLVAIPTLEAGRQVLHSADAANAVTVEVPPLPAGALDVPMTSDGRPVANRSLQSNSLGERSPWSRLSGSAGPAGSSAIPRLPPRNC